MAGTGIACSVALCGGSRWWHAVDGRYARTLWRPVASDAQVVAGAGGARLRVTVTDTRWMTGRTTPLVPDHGTLVHLVAVREGGGDAPLDVLAHLHPARLASATFETPRPARESAAA